MLHSHQGGVQHGKELAVHRRAPLLRDRSPVATPGRNSVALMLLCELYLPSGSYLIHKLEGVHTITGDGMPQFGPYLTRGEIDSIRSWIRFGALDN